MQVNLITQFWYFFVLELIFEITFSNRIPIESFQI